MSDNKDEIELLVFSAAGITMAVDTAQVDCLISSERAELQGIPFVRLNDILSLGIKSPAGSTVIQYRDKGEAYGLEADDLDEMITTPVMAIQPMPAPLSSFPGSQIFRGAVLRQNTVVLLIDLYRLKGLNPCEAGHTA